MSNGSTGLPGEPFRSRYMLATSNWLISVGGYGTLNFSISDDKSNLERFAYFWMPKDGAWENPTYSSFFCLYLRYFIAGIMSVSELTKIAVSYKRKYAKNKNYPCRSRGSDHSHYTILPTKFLSIGCQGIRFRSPTSEAYEWLAAEGFLVYTHAGSARYII